jgi:uncharacterized membrane protein YphA (DoxX/SURF4 family)
VQDRLHATTYFVYPMLLACMALIWVASGVVGFVTPSEEIRQLFAHAGLPHAAGPPFVWVVSAIDAVLGILILFRRFAHVAILLMLASVLGYTLLIGSIWSEFWLDPFGGLLKNLALVPALLLLLAWNRQR